MKNLSQRNASKKQKQAVEATATEQAAPRTEKEIGMPFYAESPEQKVERLKRELADAKAVTKAVKQKVKTPCAKAGCKLFACEGGKGFCSNHRPLNNDELDFAATLAQEMNGESLINLLGDQRIRMMFRNQQQKG